MTGLAPYVRFTVKNVGFTEFDLLRLYIPLPNNKLTTNIIL